MELICLTEVAFYELRAAKGPFRDPDATDFARSGAAQPIWIPALDSVLSIIDCALSELSAFEPVCGAFSD
jgi:hypothetical protein